MAVPLVMPDHSIKYLHAVAHATRDHDGQLEYIAAVQDVTARAPVGRGARQGQDGTCTRCQGDEPGNADGINRPRNQPAVVRHCHKRQHLSADAGR